MQKRCEPRIVQNTYKKTHSWRKTAESLNALYGVDLPFLTWRDYATGRRDITDIETRDRLQLGKRPCPACGRKHITRKRSKAAHIREYGYPATKILSFDEILDLREAMR